MSDTPKYPKRPRYFACKFVRLMAKKCVANELGPHAFTLLAVVVMTEDARGYDSAVNFYNGQLQPMAGLRSEATLARVRKRCVEAGWLHYVPGGQRRGPGRYWVTIPERHAGTDDAPTDEGEDDRLLLCKSDGQNMGQNDGQKVLPPVLPVISEGQNVVQNGGQTGGKTEALPPVPSPIPKDTHKPAGPGSVCEDGPGDEDTPPVGPNPEAVIAHWNAHPGLLPYVGIDPSHERKIRTWATQNPLWVAHWHATIVFLGRTPFYCGGGQRKWRAKLGWLLKEDNFTNAAQEMLADPAAVPSVGSTKPVIKLASDNALSARALASQDCPPMEVTRARRV